MAIGIAIIISIAAILLTALTFTFILFMRILKLESEIFSDKQRTKNFTDAIDAI